MHGRVGDGRKAGRLAGLCQHLVPAVNVGTHGSVSLDFRSSQSVHGTMKFIQKLPFINPGPRLSEIVGTYLYSCEVEGKTPRMIQAYTETLGQFLDAAKEENFPDNVAKINATRS